MRMHFRRWRFREGNSDIVIDNAWNLTGWTQERLVINGETAAEASGWWRTSQAFDQPWLSRMGETELRVQLKADLRTVTATVRIDGRALEPEEDILFDWSGPRREWPPLDREMLQRVAHKLRAQAAAQPHAAG